MAAHNADATLLTSLEASPELSVVRGHFVGAAFVTALASTVGLQVIRNRKVSCQLATDLSASVNLRSIRNRSVSASLSSSLVATVNLATPQNRKVCAKFTTSLDAGVNLRGASDLRGRTICDLVKESLSLWGFLCAKSAPRYALERAITDINTALQLVWNNADGRDYWSNETLTITLADGESSFTLPDDVQNVTGPCRRQDDHQPLTPVRTIGELETFADIYLEGASLPDPVAYHVERLKQSADDPAKCVLHVTPAVSGDSVSFLLEVVKECPRYTVDNLTSCPLVPIPHQYAETLLIPIIRYQASSYYLFAATDATQKETIDREYQQARISLGLADPNPAKAAKEGGEK